jgi:hypothetical protein
MFCHDGAMISLDLSDTKWPYSLVSLSWAAEETETDLPLRISIQMPNHPPASEHKYQLRFEGLPASQAHQALFCTSRTSYGAARGKSQMRATQTQVSEALCLQVVKE